MIKICLPSRFELELLEALSEVQERTGRIHEVYGALTRSRLGSGRPARRVSQAGGEPTFGDLQRFTERAHALGIRVNYLLNGALIDLREYDSAAQRALARLLEQILDAGVDMVTVAVPYLIEAVRAAAPELPVSVSVIAGVESPQGLRHMQALGVARVQVAEDCNRDFDLLGALVEGAQAELSLIVNNGCLRCCGYRRYHDVLCTQASQERDGTDRYIDHPLLRCSAARARDPVELLRSPWIRPEDLTFYHERFGIELFKIAGRQLPSERIARIARAYAELSYEGNFLDLLATPAVDFRRHPMTAEIAAQRGAERFARPQPFIDNARLGKLTRAIHARGGCPLARDCESCRLCDQIAPRVMDLDPAGEEHAAALEELLTDLAGGHWSADVRPGAPAHAR